MILEHADLLSIIKNCLFDTICHEHLEYYSTNVIINLMKKFLRVFDIKQNNINGGSCRYFICHENAKFKDNLKKISSIIKSEKKYKLQNTKTFIKFYKRINIVKKETNKIISNLLSKGKSIHGYGVY